MSKRRENTNRVGAVPRHLLGIKILAVTAVIAMLITGLYLAGPSIAGGDEENDEDIIYVHGYDGLKDALKPENDGKTVKLTGDPNDYINYVYKLDPYGYPFIDIRKPAFGPEWGMTIDLNGYKINAATIDIPEFTEESKFMVIGSGVSITIKDSSEEKTGTVMNSMAWNVFSDTGKIGGMIWNDGNLTIEDITFRGGHAKECGGAIYNDVRGVLTLKDVNFALCQAETCGGAIYNKGKVSIIGGSLSGNAAGEYGGAIYNEGTVEIEKAFMTMNEAQLEGGAIYNTGEGKMVIRGGEISNNISGNGGAIYNHSNVVWTDMSGSHYAIDISGTEFRHNKATKETEVEGGSGYGGTIWNDGNISVKDAMISGSLADRYGGGIYNSRIMSISGSTIYGCDAATYGGGIYSIGDDAKVNVRDSTLSENSTQLAGGAVFNELFDKDFDTTQNNFTLEACKIIDNTTDASAGVGAGLQNSGVMVVKDCEIRGNKCNGAGGIYDTGRLFIYSTLFESNSVENGDGAALTIRNGGYTVAEFVVFKNNYTDRGNGGAISITDGGTLDLGTSLITDNTAMLYAGAIYVQVGASLIIHDLVKVHGNTADIGKDIFLQEGTKIGFSGPVNPLSLVDFAMEDPYQPFTDHFALYSCPQGVFVYNEVEDFPLKQDVVGDLPELFCDYEYWNTSKIGMRLVSTWGELKDLADDESIPNGTEVALANNLYAGGDGCITITRGLIIDLNGFTIDRQLDEEHENGHVFKIKDHTSATIKDTIGTGKITGGYTMFGGAIYIEDGSKLTIESGFITGNKATISGGAIHVDGELEMGGGSFYDNRCEANGGAIYCDDYDDCTLNLNNVVFYKNIAENDGGALYLDFRNACTIRNCEFIECASKDDGGAIFMEADDQMLYIIDCVFHGNSSQGDGGAIYIEDGGLEISGDSCEFAENQAEGSGGVVYTDERKVVVKDKVRFHDNATNHDGGAFYTEGIVELGSGVEVSHNRADRHGGAICIKDGSTVNINSGATLSYNEAGGNGGAVYCDDNGNINLWGGRIEYNSAEKGGAIYMTDDADDIDVSGDIVVMYNEAVEGNGVYLVDTKMKIVGELDVDANISVTLGGQTGRFTSGFSKYNSDKDPIAYFTSPEGYLVSLDNGEARLSYDYSIADDESDFIEWASQINDYCNLSDKNWMSGISGERRLNEINIPGTHDSGMKKTESRFVASVGDFAHMHYMAKTQYLYINEQLDAGVRLFDIRINNQHLVPDPAATVWNIGMALEWGALTWSTPVVYSLEDDGDNLWICHGKDSIGGTFYAMKPNGDDLSVDDVLDWFKTFLTIHPTETIIAGFDAEVQGDDDDNVKITNERMYQKLLALSEEINPSTGKPYIYIEPGKEFGDNFTEYPCLKDCRGQIVLQGGGFGGIGSEKIDPVINVYSQDVGFNCTINEKKDSIDKFLDEHVNDTYLTSDVTSHLEVLHKIGFNVGPTGTKYYIGKYFQSFVDKDIGPLYNADHILPDYLAKSKPFDQRGKYVGWVKTDGATAEHHGYIWRSNFPDPKDSDPTKFTLNYVTVKAESGLGAYPIQIYNLLLGTTIVLPGCIYADHGDLEFKGWMVDGELLQPGTEYVLLKDTDFVATWNVEEFTISYVDYDGSEIDSYHYIPGTSAADIAAQAPTAYREATAQYTYVFSGWEPDFSDVTGDMTYTAKYDAILNTYGVTWMTWDGLYVIETDENVGYGSQPYYNGPPQTKEETVQHTYTFLGWSEHVDSEDGVPIEDLPAVTGDVTYYASFKSTVKLCTIRFLDWDDTVLWEGRYAMETVPAVITPPDPVREPSGGKYYEFAAWSPAPATVREDADYRATYNESDVLRYCITFMDWNANIVSKEWYLAGTSYSDVIVPADPVREPTTQFSYTFAGWVPTVPETGQVTESVTYRAVYDYTVNKYTVSFYNWDGTLLHSKDYDFGTPAEDIVMPEAAREMDSQYVYTFSCWSPEVTDVDTDAAYMATYDAELRTFTVTWANYDGQVLETDQNVQYGSIPSYDGATPERAQDEKRRYIFYTWSPMVSFVSGDVTYTAEYNAMGLQFTITYELNGGEFYNGHPATVTYTYGQEVRLYWDEQVGKEFYVFGAWHDNPELTGEPYTKLSNETFGDWTFYMDWVPAKYDVWVYDNDGSRLIDRIPYTVETETFTLDIPTKDGYTFSYWENEAGDKLKEAVIEKGSGYDRRFWAHWVPSTYDIEYYDGETKLTGIDPATYVYNVETYLGQLPDKEGCIRAGWYTTSDFQEGTEATKVPAGTIGAFKVYAKYDAKGDIYWKTLPAAIEGLVYGESPQVLITGGEATDGDAFYAVNDGEFVSGLPEATDAGEYCVQYKIVKDNTDYDIGWVFVTIDKAASSITKAPTAKEGLEFNNSEQELVTAGEASVGDVYYSLDGENFYIKISKATNAGQYNVWYRSGGDNNHYGAPAAGPISVTIAKIAPGQFGPPETINLTYNNGKPQELIRPISADYNIEYSLDNKNYSRSVPCATDAGEYTVYYMVKDDVNHFDSEPATVKATIAKLERSWATDPKGLVAEPAGKVLKYNKEEQVLIVAGVTTSGNALYRVGDSGDYSSELPKATEIGDYTIWYKIDGDDNYSLPEPKSTVASIKIPIPLMAMMESWTYGEEASKPIIIGNVGEGETTIGYRLASSGDEYSPGVPVASGEYSMKVSVAASGDYGPASIAVNFSIYKAPFTPTVSINGWTYGDEANKPTLSGNISGGTVVYRYKLSGASDDTYSKEMKFDAGDYIVKATVSAKANYLEEEATASFTIAKASIAPTVSVAGWTYGMDPSVPEVTGNFGNGTLTYMYKKSGAPDTDYTSQVPTDAGSYVLKAIVSATTNYNGGEATVEFSIGKANVSVTADDLSKVYGSADPELTATVQWNSGGPGGAIDYTLSRVEGENVGTYVISVSAESNDNYAVTVQSGQFKIMRASATIKADDASKVYGSADPELTATVQWNSGGPGGAIDYTLSRAGGEDVGTYVISVSAASTDNYAVTLQPGTFTVTQKAATIKADDASKVYGSDDPVLTATVEGLVGSDTIPYTLSRAAGEDAGSYKITVSVGTTKNYTVTAQSGTFTIDPKPVTIWANNASKMYGSDDPELTATVDGLIGSDTISYTVKRAAGDDAGTYEITVHAESTKDYEVSVRPGTFTIDPKPAVIIVDDASKVYGSDDPKLTATVEGLVGSDTISYTLSRAAGEDVGTYEITASVGTTKNYTVTAQSGTFTIAQKPAVVKADDLIKLYGSDDPKLTATVTGLLYGDEVGYTISREPGEFVGEYAITVSGEESQGNYNVSYRNGTLTIDYPEKSETDEDEDTTVTGNIDPTAVLVATERIEESDWKGVDLSDKDVLLGYDLTLVGALGVPFTGELTVTFKIGEKYDDIPVMVYHHGKQGIDEFRRIVEDGEVSVTVTDLSPFIVVIDKELEPSDSNAYIAVIIVGVLLVIAVSGYLLYRRRAA